MTVSARIGVLLKERGRTQVELANYLGVDVRMVNRWVKQGVTPSGNYLLRIASFFQVPPETLFGEPEPHIDVKRYSIREFTTDELLVELKRRIEAP